MATLQNLPLPRTNPVSTHVAGSDVNEFLIEVFDSETAKVIQTLSLAGTNRPFTDIQFPVSQHVEPHYYPGSANRIPTLHVMGGMDENVRLEGVFEARKLRTGRRNEPREIVNTLVQLTREGNICKFQIGPWIRFGIIVNFTPIYQTNSLWKWNMDIMVVSETNPLLKKEAEEAQRVNAIFGETNTSDSSGVSQSVISSINVAKNELQITNYLPQYQTIDDRFTLGHWIARLRQVQPIGRVADIGDMVYNQIIQASQIANEFLDNVDRFANTVENVGQEATKLILTIESLRSRVFSQVTSLYNSYSLVSSSLNTATRLSSFNPISVLGGVYFDLGSILKEIEDSTRSSQRNILVRTHVVKVNDTLQTISTRYYGDFNRWTDIKNANDLPNSDINENQILVIPE